MPPTLRLHPQPAPSPGHHHTTKNAQDPPSERRSPRQRKPTSPLSPTHPHSRPSPPARPRSSADDAPQRDPDDVPMAEHDHDTQHPPKPITPAKRNFDKVNFGQWQIRTWYFSPYPLTDFETEDVGAGSQSTHAPGTSRPTVRSHGRTSDLMACAMGQSHGSEIKPLLWVCDRCFKYMADGLRWELHIRKCTRKRPPGRKVYQRGAHTIWEVDGAKEKLYCQNLSLFGKLFIDVKTLFFDCDNFLFYILTDADSQRDHALGFFSKEKISYDDYNLACIIILPPYQRKGYGMLLIEFSYELSRRAGKVGTPERPLSTLGLRSYLTYWTATLIRFLRRLLSIDRAELPQTSKRRMVNMRSSSKEVEDGVRVKKKKAKGWDGEEIDPTFAITPLSEMTDSLYTSLRTIETRFHPDGSATSHVIVKCTLADIARATNLRPEDAAFALNECGLLSRKENVHDETVIAISREMVEKVAKERKVKMMCMDMAHVLL